MTIPDPPEAIQACIKTKGDISNGNFTITGQNATVDMEIIDPKGSNSATIHISALVQNISECSKEANPDILYLGIGVIVVILLVLILIIVIKIHQKRTNILRSLKPDENDVYGEDDYDSEGGRREVVAEVEDRNSTYGAAVEGWEGANIRDFNQEYE